jgi:hypothetical protein
MSSDFVRYSPEIETIDPDLDEYMTRIIDEPTSADEVLPLPKLFPEEP